MQDCIKLKGAVTYCVPYTEVLFDQHKKVTTFRRLGGRFRRSLRSLPKGSSLRERRNLLAHSICLRGGALTLNYRLRPHPTKNVNAGAVCFRGNFVTTQVCQSPPRR